MDLQDFRIPIGQELVVTVLLLLLERPLKWKGYYYVLSNRLHCHCFVYDDW